MSGLIFLHAQSNTAPTQGRVYFVGSTSANESGGCECGLQEVTVALWRVGRVGTVSGFEAVPNAGFDMGVYRGGSKR